MDNVLKKCMALMFVVVFVFAVYAEIGIAKKTKIVFTNSLANQYEKAVNSLVPESLFMQEEPVDSKVFVATLDTMKQIFVATEDDYLMNEETSLYTEEEIKKMFDSYYQEFEIAKNQTFASKAEMLSWMETTRIMKPEKVRAIITGFSKTDIVIWNLLLISVASGMVVLLVMYKNKSSIFE